MRIKSLSIAFMLALSLILSFSASLKAETDKNKAFHRIHVMLNHGLNMVMDGSTLIMTKGMVPESAEEVHTVEHGNAMIAEGKAFIDRALHGPVMVDMHVKKEMMGKMMDSTHRLGELILKAVFDQKVTVFSPDVSEVSQKLHIINLDASHALMMASQGSNMVMTGQDDASNDLSRYSIEHGKEMMLRARTILIELLHSTLMKDLEKKQLTPDDEKNFTYTKERLITSVDIASILVEMEFD